MKTEDDKQAWLDFTRLLKPEDNFANRLIAIDLEPYMFFPSGGPFTIRIDGMVIVLVFNGEAKVNIDYISYHLKKDHIILLGKNHLLDQSRVSHNFKGVLIACENDFLVDTFHEESHVLIEELISLKLNPVHALKEKDMRLIREIVARLRQNIGRDSHKFQKSLVHNEFSNFLLELWTLGETKTPALHRGFERDFHKELIPGFAQLLFKHCKTEHEIAFYAGQLGVSPVYLSRFVRTISGKPASKWISEAIIAEAKIMFRKPDISIREIAEDLHFSDQSSFGKFFKKHTGLSPLAYKNRINGFMD